MALVGEEAEGQTPAQVAEGLRSSVSSGGRAQSQQCSPESSAKCSSDSRSAALLLAAPGGFRVVRKEEVL